MRLLSEGEARAEAAGALWSLSTGDDETKAAVADAGAIPPLVALLAEAGPVRLRAAGALGTLGSGSLTYQTAVADSGGIDPLVELLGDGKGFGEGGSPGELEAHAARSLAHLALAHDANPETIAQAGAIPALVALLADATDAAAPAAVTPAADADLAKWRVPSGTAPLQWAREEAAGALHALAFQRPANQSAIAQAGGLEPLVALLSSGSDGAQEKAARALAALAFENAANEELICSQIVSLLAAPAKQAVARAARAIGRLSKVHRPSNQLALARAGAISLLVTLLSTDSHEGARKTNLKEQQHQLSLTASLQRESAAALGALADGHPPNQAAIAAEGGIEPLVAILNDKHHPEVHCSVAGALWSLGIGHAPNQKAIANADGIAPLVHLLAHGTSTEAKETAAGAIGVLASLDENRAAIAKANGVQALVALFDLDSVSAAGQAAAALTALATDDLANQQLIAKELVHTLDAGARVEAQEHATRLLGDLATNPAIRGAIAAAGAIPQLVRQLRDGSTGAQEMAAAALSQIALQSTETRVGVIQELVSLLRVKEAAVRQRAYVALKNLAAAGSALAARDGGMAGVVMADGVGPIVALLKDGYVEAQEYALWSLSLSKDAKQRRAIMEGGAVEPLISALTSGKLSADAQEHAAAVLSMLTAMTASVADLVLEAQAAAAQAAGGADVSARESGATLVVRAGGIAPLVNLVRAGTMAAKRHAAKAIAQLASGARVDGLIALICKAGAVGALIEWLPRPVLDAADAEPHPAPPHAPGGPARQAGTGGHAHGAAHGAGGEPGPPELAARALCDLARSNRDMQSGIAEEGAIERLVAMLGGGGGASSGGAEGKGGSSADGLQWAAAALAALADGHSLNQVGIAIEGGVGALVRLLQATHPPVREQATRALTALAGDSDNQLAISEAGGIAPLAAMLQTSSAVAQQDGAAAAAALCRECEETQLAFAEAGAIPPLVALLGSSVQATREHASTALLHIAEPAAEPHRAALLGAVSGALAEPKAQRMAAALLASLAGRSTAWLGAVAATEGAIGAAVKVLGRGDDGTAEAEVAAGLLALLGTTLGAREASVEAGAAEPLLAMLASALASTRLAAVGALSCLATSTSAAAALGERAVAPLVKLLGEKPLVPDDPWAAAKAAEARALAARVLALLVGAPSVRAALVRAQAVAPLLAMLEWAPGPAGLQETTSGRSSPAPAGGGGVGALAGAGGSGGPGAATGAKPAVTMHGEASAAAKEGASVRRPPPPGEVQQGQQAAAAVLAELARGGFDEPAVLSAIGTPAGLRALVAMLGEERQALSRRHAASALWGLAAADEAQRKAIVGAGAIPPLVALLSRAAEAQGVAVAALGALARSSAGQRALAQHPACVDPLVTIAYGRVGWLRLQAADLLALLGHVDPPPRAPGPPRTAWAAEAPSARGAALGGAALLGGGALAADAPSTPAAAALAPSKHLSISNRITRSVLAKLGKSVATISVTLPTGGVAMPGAVAAAPAPPKPGLGAPPMMPPHVPLKAQSSAGSLKVSPKPSPRSSPLMRFHVPTSTGS